ncbi:MAG: RNA polymerase sigma-70 factor [Runella sp.]
MFFVQYIICTIFDLSTNLLEEGLALKQKAWHSDLGKWVQRIVEGDMAAYRYFYEHFYADLYRFAVYIVKSEVVAEDIVHDVFVKVWENRQQLNHEQSIKSYLFTICRNHALNTLAKAATENRLRDQILQDYQQLSSDNDPTDTLYPEEIIQKALEALPDQRRKVFEMAKIKGLSYQQIAQELDISTGTVSDHIVKANRFLRQYFEKK